MLGIESVEHAFAQPPAAMTNVGAEAWESLRASWSGGTHEDLWDAAWANGRAFLEAGDALRGRPPLRVEWKGPHKPPGYDSLPADLRVDHVYLVSCKYGSDISANSSPSNLFMRLLAERTTQQDPWYVTVAPAAYDEFYDAVRAFFADIHLLPLVARDLTAADVAVIRAHCKKSWPPSLRDPWQRFSFSVATESAELWRGRLDTKAKQELMLWRLLRLETSPYFVLGTSKAGAPMRYRVATPWDWRQEFELLRFDVEPVVAGQPLVRWTGVVRRRVDGQVTSVTGDVEIRWSHGRFSAVEAKLHLKTTVTEVPGYFQLQ